MSNIIITNGKNINTANGSINAGSGTITTTGSLSCGAITTNNNNITAGTGTITTTGQLSVGTIRTNYITYPTYDSSYIIGIPLTATIAEATMANTIFWFKPSGGVHLGDVSLNTYTFAKVVPGTYMVVFNAHMYSLVSPAVSHYKFIIRLGGGEYCLYEDNTLQGDPNPYGQLRHISITKIVKVEVMSAELQIGYGAVSHGPKFPFAHLEVCKIG